MLTELEKKILASIQGDIPVIKCPYLGIAEKIGITEDEFLQKLQDLCDSGIVRRFGATLRHQKTGFSANAMVAWQVDENRIDGVGETMASFKEVSHCYRRNPTEQWPYNLYTMVHATDEDSCRKTAEKMAEQASITKYSLLFSVRELKKTSMTYFPEEAETEPDEVKTKPGEVKTKIDS